MEKEINIELDYFVLNFYFEGFDFSKKELEEYRMTLSMMAKGFHFFISDQFSIKDKVFNLNLNLCDNDRIIELNNEFRNKKKITDVLSFPLQESLRLGDYDSFCPEIELGDIYICHSICEEQAIEFKLSFLEEFIHLGTHGFLHLSGYDHEINKSEELLMESFEEKIINFISSIKNQ